MMEKGDNKKSTPWVDNLRYFLNHNGYETKGNLLSIEGIVNSIDNNIPVLVAVDPSPNSLGGGHLVTITGYSLYGD